MAQSVVTSAPVRSALDPAAADIQGLLRFAHGHLTEASFILLRIADRDAARAWLKAARVTNAVAVTPLPETALQIAVTCGGLRQLGLGDDIIGGFSDEFIEGLSGNDNRLRRRGDSGENSPNEWRWGGPGREPHLLIMLYARSGRLTAFADTVMGGSWSAAFTPMEVLTTTARERARGFSR